MNNSSSPNIFAEAWFRELVGDIDMPARKIGRSRFYMRGNVASEKGLASQEAESSLEHDFLTLLEFDKKVHRYLAQPFTIEWKDSTGSMKKYTPDVLVKYAPFVDIKEPWLKTTIFEVKPIEILRRDWEELRPKYKAATGWAKEFGCIFRIVTEKEIRTPYLTNARFLKRYRQEDIEEDTELFKARYCHARDMMKKLKYSTPRELMLAMASYEDLQAEMIPYIWYLMLEGDIGADLTKPLNMNTPIYWKLLG